MKQGFEKRDVGEMVACIGKTRCGKTTYAIAKTKSKQRVLVWDPAGQFANKLGCKTFRDLTSLWGAIKGNNGNGKYAFNFMGDGKDLKKAFSDFCYIGFYWGVLKPCVIVAEELAQVSNPAKGEGYWGTLTRNGLKYGTDIIAMAQRTQEIDKTLLGNCTKIVQFKVDLDNDRAKTLSMLGFEAPREYYLFIEKNNVVGSLKHGKTTKQGTVSYLK